MCTPFQLSASQKKKNLWSKGYSDSRLCCNYGAKRHLARMCPKKWSKGLHVVAEGDENILEEVAENGDELHAWSTLEESESEQREQVVSKQRREKH